jgi:hypothetical protein
VGCRGRKAPRWQVAPELISGQVKKCSQRRQLVRVTPVMRLGTLADLKIARPRAGSLWTAQHRFHRAGESDGPPCKSRTGPPYLGHSTAVPTPVGSSGVVAGLLSRMSRPHQSLRVALVQPRERGANWQRTALGNGRKLWQPAELIDDGRRARCSLVPCHRFPLESYDCQVQLQSHVVEWLGNVQAEAVG